METVPFRLKSFRLFERCSLVREFVSADQFTTEEAIFPESNTENVQWPVAYGILSRSS